MSYILCDRIKCLRKKKRRIATGENAIIFSYFILENVSTKWNFWFLSDVLSVLMTVCNAFFSQWIPFYNHGNIFYWIAKLKGIVHCKIQMILGYVGRWNNRSNASCSYLAQCLCWLLSDAIHCDFYTHLFQVVMMLMIVVILFAFCWTPVLVNNVLVAFGHTDYLNMGYLKPLRMIFHLMSYANSCVNPFVYAFMSKNFRDGFKQSILACIKGQAYLRRSHTNARSMTSTTRASSTNGDTKMGQLL